MAGQRKVGHAGTLDPMATGVLLVCLGQATRVAEFLMAGRKRYRATIVLGTTTDTYDVDGKILTEGAPCDFSRDEIETALQEFVGPVQQVPPLFSAIKQGGQPLHRLARQGVKLQVAPRRVEIDEILLLDWTTPSLILEVVCSPGTYVRSLAHDLGQRLGSGAYLGSLVRLRSGRFTLEHAVSLARLEEAFLRGEEYKFLRPLDEALLDLPALLVGVADAQRVMQGMAIQGGPSLVATEGNRVRRAYSLDGRFLAIVDYDTNTGTWKPRKVFVTG
jgi:tRNA pseudouridine55 synthase